MENVEREEMRRELNNMKEQIAGMMEFKDQVAQLVELMKGKNVIPPEPKNAGTSGTQGEGHLEIHGRRVQVPPIIIDEEFRIPEFEENEIHNQGTTAEIVIPNQLEILEERLKALEGTNIYGLTDASQLCLVPGVVIPPKFKTPEFEKYEGLTCPQGHLSMYCSRMAGYINNEKLLVHVFQESLTGSALRWYMQLGKDRVKRWRDLADAFLKHYKHNLDMAPSREDLRSMEKRNTETFKEYALRWRDKASQVIPPLTEKEMVSNFLETLSQPFYGMLLANTSTNLSDIVLAGERIEQGIKKGKVEDKAYKGSNSQQQYTGKRKEGEAQMIAGYLPNTSPYRVMPTYSNHSQYIANTSAPYLYQSPRNPIPYGPKPSGSPVIRPRIFEQFDPIPMTYTELLPQLLQSRQLSVVPIEPMKPPFPKWYNENAKCEYHAGVTGHSTENCTALKRKVQALVKAGWLKFNQGQQTPNINNNPLPSHEMKG